MATLVYKLQLLPVSMQEMWNIVGSQYEYTTKEEDAVMAQVGKDCNWQTMHVSPSDKV